MIRNVLLVLVLAVSALLVLTGCTGGRTGEEVWAPKSPDPSITVTLPPVTTVVPNTDVP